MIGDEVAHSRPTGVSLHTTTAPVEGTERKLDRLLAHYAESHRHPVNELIHVIAIPAIMVSIVGLLFALHPWVAYAFVGASLVYYALLHSPVLLAIMAAWTVLLIGVATAMGDKALAISLSVFVVGWVFQFIGHKIEGRKPSFFEDIQYLWVGPLFVVTLALR